MVFRDWRKYPTVALGSKSRNDSHHRSLIFYLWEARSHARSTSVITEWSKAKWTVLEIQMRRYIPYHSATNPVNVGFHLKTEFNQRWFRIIIVHFEEWRSLLMVVSFHCTMWSIRNAFFWVNFLLGKLFFWAKKNLLLWLVTSGLTKWSYQIYRYNYSMTQFILYCVDLLSDQFHYVS